VSEAPVVVRADEEGGDEGGEVGGVGNEFGEGAKAECSGGTEDLIGIAEVREEFFLESGERVRFGLLGFRKVVEKREDGCEDSDRGEATGGAKDTEKFLQNKINSRSKIQ